MGGPAAEEGSRPAEPRDIPRLAELAGEAVAELTQNRGGEVWSRTAARTEPYDTGLEADLADPDHQVLVGTVDGHVMGYAVAHVERLRDGSLLGVVTDLYTEPGCREIGLGEQMMQSLIDWCAERGCFGVDSMALPGDRHTKNFFESFGLVARGITVHRSLL